MTMAVKTFGRASEGRQKEKTTTEERNRKDMGPQGDKRKTMNAKNTDVRDIVFLFFVYVASRHYSLT